LSGFAHKIRDQTQHHHQQQGEGWNDSAEEAGKFIAGQHLTVTAKPEYHSGKNAAHSHAMQQRFQSIGSGEYGKENRIPKSIKKGIHSSDYQKDRNETQDQGESLSSL